MEIIDDGGGKNRFLTEFEVLRLLKERDKQREREYKANPKAARKQKNSDSVKVEMAMMKYLESAPASTQQEEHIRSFIEQIAPYKLTKQQINKRPTTLVEVNLLLDSGAKLDEDKLEEILGLVNKVFPDAPVVEADVEEEEEEEWEEEEGEEGEGEEEEGEEEEGEEEEGGEEEGEEEGEDEGNLIPETRGVSDVTEFEPEVEDGE